MGWAGDGEGMVFRWMDGLLGVVMGGGRVWWNLLVLGVGGIDG